MKGQADKQPKAGAQRRTRAKANRKLLTEANVKTLPLKRKQYLVWDGGNGRGSGECERGLAILVSPSGTRSYRSTYYFPNSPKPHSRHLGRVREITLDKARELCANDRTLAKQGIDPKGNGTKSDGYKELVVEYVKHEVVGRRNNASYQETQRMLLKDCAEWHMRPVATILPTEVQALLNRVRDGNKDEGLKARPYLANKLHNRLSMFFDWCAKPQNGQRIKVSPMLGIEKPWNGEKRRVREWFKGQPGDEAIRAIWAAADQIGGDEGRYIKILMLTGKRKSDVAEMDFRHIDASWYWYPPKSDNPIKRVHSIPLPSLAQRILHPRNREGLVFKGEHDGHIYVNGMSLRNKIAKASGIADFFYHGLRHLAETKMAELKIPQHLRDMLLDHRSDRGSGDDYDHHEYRDEKLAAMEKWAAHIEKLVQPEGVALLR
jgi:integrase